MTLDWLLCSREDGTWMPILHSAGVWHIVADIEGLWVVHGPTGCFLNPGAAVNAARALDLVRRVSRMSPRFFERHPFVRVANEKAFRDEREKSAEWQQLKRVHAAWRNEARR